MTLSTLTSVAFLLNAIYTLQLKITMQKLLIQERADDTSDSEDEFRMSHNSKIPCYSEHLNNLP